MSNIKVPYMPISDFKISDEILEGTDDLDADELNAPEESSQDFLLILQGIGLEKYKDLFSKRRVQFDTFLKLNEADLKELGITDPKDIETFLRKLCTDGKQTSDSELIVNENHVEDLQMVKNVSRHLILLQNYCAYVALQLKKNKLTDYNVGSNEFASSYLKAFTETALIQSQILSHRIYDQSSDNGLIDKTLKKYNLTLSPIYQKVLPKKIRKGNSTVMKVLVVLSISSLVIALGKCLKR